MSFDDYARYIAQKFRLAISIAVLKTKPPNITLEDHIHNLRINLNDERPNLEDSIISISSVDFNINETDFDDIGKNTENAKNTAETYREDNSDQMEVNETICNQPNDNNDINNENFCVDVIETQELNNSITILENFNEPHVRHAEDNLEDVMDILRDIDDHVEIEKTINKGQPKQPSINLLHQELCQDITPSLCFTNNNIESLNIVSIDNINREYNNSKISNFDNLNKNGLNEVERWNDTEIKQIDYKPKPYNQLDNTMKKYDTQSNFNENQTYLEINRSQGAVPKLAIKENKGKTGKNNTKKSKKAQENKSPVKRIKFTDTIREYDTQTVDLTNSEYQNTHYSESQNDVFIIEDKYIRNINKKVNDKQYVNKTPEKNGDILKETTDKHQNPLSTNIQECNDFNANDVNISQELISNNINSEQKDLIIHNITDVKNNQDSKKISDSISVDVDIFSQESQLFFPCSLNSKKIVEVRDGANSDQKAVHNINNFYLQNSLLMDYSLTQNNIVSKNPKEKVDKDFSQETHVSAFSKPSNSLNTENDTAFAQNTQVFNYFDINQPHSSKTNLQHNCNIFNNNLRDLATENVEATSFDKFGEIKNTNKTMTYRQEINRANIISNLEYLHETDNTKNWTEFDKHQTETNPKTLTGTIETQKLVESCTNFDDLHEDWTDSQIELIPFKILEEMSKVKSFLNKKTFDDHSSDTGYKSDTLSRNSILSQTPFWLNQSAHSLLKYVFECPLVGTTEDITNEISVVLGELIDQLHDEENYPSFLEELLESVKSLLKLIYEGNTEDNGLLKKDEQCQRLLILNKSIHIQKFSIEKITDILEDLLKDLTNKDTAFEIQNTDKAENVCYIFHILQILLQKYKKTTENLSQNTQSSQEEERVLKRSNITDIWKKKWNPNHKISFVGSLEKKFEVATCGVVLNKLIVNCMDGYSLISYFALKCFNIMQN